MPKMFSISTKEIIASAELVYVSAASVWEAGIKQQIGKLKLPGPFIDGVDQSGFERLSILFEHCQRATELPLHHRDPFDRILAAQALHENLTFVTRDPIFRNYGVDLLEI